MVGEASQFHSPFEFLSGSGRGQRSAGIFPGLIVRRWSAIFRKQKNDAEQLR